MHEDNQQPPSEPPPGESSVERRREILRRIGKASAVAGAAASPLSALATNPRRWCKDIPANKCVHASISGMGSVVMSAQASNEVCSKKCSHYANTANWPATCSNGTVAITHGTEFRVAFKCDVVGAKDSLGVDISNVNCLLRKSLASLCSSHASTSEAHWATALANANKLATPAMGAPFPYTPGQVVGHFLDLGIKASAYTFYTTYCENYA